MTMLNENGVIMIKLMKLLLIIFHKYVDLLNVWRTQKILIDEHIVDVINDFSHTMNLKIEHMSFVKLLLIMNVFGIQMEI